MVLLVLSDYNTFLIRLAAKPLVFVAEGLHRQSVT